MECQFYEAIDLGTETEDWEFSKVNCTATSVEGILIENASTSASFYLKPSINYGDILVIAFLMIFGIIIIAKWIGQFIFKD